MATKIKGIDISYCQKGLNLTKAVADGYKFAIIRISHGIKQDTEFENHIKSCIENKIPWGVYVYSEAMTVKEAQAEAQQCIKLLNGRLPEYPVFFDMEMSEQVDNLSTSDRTAICKAFCDTIKAAKLFPAIYANPTWLDYYYDKSELLKNYDFWLAHWVDDGKQAKYGQHIWQHGVVKIDGMDVDGNFCYINYPAKLRAYYKSVGNETLGATINENNSDKHTLSVGDIIKIKPKSKYYGIDTAIPTDISNRQWYVTSISGDRVVINKSVDGNYDGINSAVSLDDVMALQTPQAERISLKVGDIVRIKPNAKTYNGTNVHDWVLKLRFIVDSVSGNRIVINKSPDNASLAINTAFNANDLIKC